MRPFPFRHEWVPRLAEAMIFIATRDLDEGEELCLMASNWEVDAMMLANL